MDSFVYAPLNVKTLKEEGRKVIIMHPMNGKVGAKIIDEVVGKWET